MLFVFSIPNADTKQASVATFPSRCCKHPKAELHSKTLHLYPTLEPDKDLVLLQH